MTADAARRGALGRRLLLAFSLVTLVAVALVAVGAFIGTGRGLDRAAVQDRELVVTRVVAAVTDARRQAGSWESTDLAPAQAVAAAAGARLVVLDPAGHPVAGRHGSAGGDGGGGTHGNGGSGSTRGNAGAGSGQAGSGSSTTREVVVDGTTVGTVRVVFPSGPSTTARDIAWWWIGLAAVASLLLALLAGWWVTRRLSRPLESVAATARAFAGGDRGARTDVEGPGEIGDVAHALNEMADAVVRSEDGRRRVVSDVAHELRTPLAALQAGLEEARDGLVEPEPAVLARLHDQALRLGRIVDDLATLSAAESGTLRLRPGPLDLAALARSEVEAQEPRLRAADVAVTLRAEQPVEVWADADRMRQVLSNLLANAARYCRPGDEVTVTVAGRPPIASLTVADTGPGIPAAELPRVFDRLWRGQAGARVGGSGIGLAVVRELVTAHHGAVVAESDGSSGTLIRVEVPLAAVPSVERTST